MLIRHYDGESAMQRFFNSSNLGLPVSLLASALKRDAESISKDTATNESLVYTGNNCIKSSIKL